MGVPPQSPGPVTPGGQLQGTPPGMVGGFAMQNGMSPGGGGPSAGQYATVGSPPPFALDPQQTGAAHNLADLQQQVSLSSVTGALEQLQVQQQPGQSGQAQVPQAQGQAQGQAPQQAQQQPSTTIWS